MSRPLVILRQRLPSEPTEAQLASGRYPKRKVPWKGLTIRIENEAGTFRRGRKPDGGEWESFMAFAYGEVERTEGVDGDPVDVFLGPYLEDAPLVYVIHQRKVGAWDEYDEDKCMLGFDCQESAVQAFLACYDDPRFLGPITVMPVAEFIAKAKATRAAPAMIKSYVHPYIRDGKIVSGYQGRTKKPKPAKQVDLFAGGGDPHHTALEALKERVTRFASGLSRAKDFETAAWAGHAIGVEVGELSEEGMRRLAETIVDRGVPTFVDSGAFGVFMRGLKRQDAGDGHMIQGLDFDAILAKYDRLLDMVADYNEAEEAIVPPLLVMPDVVGDQIASLELIGKHRDYVRVTAQFNTARPIIPIQRGPLPMAEVYRRLVALLGTDNFVVGIPSNAAAISSEEFVAFLREAKPKAVHILGALADSRLTPRLASIVESGLADQIEVSADANPLRSIIIEKGQSAEGRRENLREKLGVRARQAELDAMIERAGGREEFRRLYENGAGRERRRRVVTLMMELTGDDEASVLREYGLSAP